MSRKFGIPRRDTKTAFSSWPLWTAAVIAVGIIDLALHLPARIKHTSPTALQLFPSQHSLPPQQERARVDAPDLP